MKRDLRTLFICVVALCFALTVTAQNGHVIVAGFAPCTSSASGTTVKPEQDASQFVNITDVVPDAILEIRYFGTYNFVGQRIDGYLQPTALMTKRAADSLKAVSDDVMRMGYRLKIYDAYRPQMAVDHFVRWAANIPDTLMRTYFYPDLDKSVLFDQEYIMEKSGHTRGSTVDLTLFDMATEKEVDMGGTFDWFGPETQDGRIHGRQQCQSHRSQHYQGTVRQPHDPSRGHAAPRLQDLGQ